MKEAIGGGWMLGFVSMFIVIFAAYLAISINYTKAFKVKNQVINIIEEHEGYTESNVVKAGNTNKDDLASDNSTEGEVYRLLNEIGYAYDVDSCPDSNASLRAGGYCIRKICSGLSSYYKVTTFISIEIPLIGVDIKVPIKGETKVIFNDTNPNSMSCS